MSEQIGITRPAISSVDAEGRRAGDAEGPCCEHVASTALADDDRRAGNRTYWQTQTLRQLHRDVVCLKDCAWSYVTAHAQLCFVGGQPYGVPAMRDELRRMAELAAKCGARLHDDVARHLVTTLADHARSLCENDALTAITAMVRVHELYMATEPRLSLLVEEWIKLGPVEGLPGIDPETDPQLLV